MFYSICSPIVCLIKLSDACPAGFAAFAHFALTYARAQVRNRFIHFVDEDRNLSSELLTERIRQIDSHVVARIIYISTPAIMIARMLNPALRRRNSELFANPAVTEIVRSFFNRWPQFSNNLNSEFNVFMDDLSYLVKEAEEMSPHHWWMEKAHIKFPNLCHIAAKVTQNSASASMTERNWSVMDYQVGCRRGSLTAENLDAIVDISFNYKALQKEKNYFTTTKLKEVMEANEHDTFLEYWCEQRANIDERTVENDAITEVGDEIDCDLVDLSEKVEIVEQYEEEFTQQQYQLSDVITLEDSDPLADMGEEIEDSLLLACVSEKAGKKRRKAKMGRNNKCRLDSDLDNLNSDMI
ncbi:hypothetical protein RCL1_001477 [Eukaryota sp. TZLM3-RCL]